MKIWDLLIKIAALITPSYLRSLNQKRHERLKLFFKERAQILASENNVPAEEKIILLNSAVSALTGVKSAKIDEFDFFLKNFNPNSFEEEYWAFSRNRPTFEVVRVKDEIVSIRSIASEQRKMCALNIFLILVMFFFPFALSRKGMKEEYHIILGIPIDILVIFYCVISFVCFITILKVIYDWTYWSDLNNLIKKKFN